MRLPLSLVLVALFPAASFAQTKEMDDAIKAKLAAIRYVQQLQDRESGAFRADPAGKPGLRATNAAVRSLKYLAGKPVEDAVPNADKAAAFVMSCYDPKTGGFADAPGGKPDVNTTSIGVMAAVELGVPKEKFRKAMDYVKEHAKTWEEVRLGAAAVEAWGVKDCPFDVKPWLDVATKEVEAKLPPMAEGGARVLGSVAAFVYRLGMEKGAVLTAEQITQMLDHGQLPDGGWGKGAGTGSDMETTYRVMRAYHMMKARPADAAKLRAFIAKCRNADGGYGVKPGDRSGVGGVYYAAIVTKWLDESEKK